MFHSLTIEVEQKKHIEKLLKCTFVRFNPEGKGFCILEVVNKIFVQIKSYFQMTSSRCIKVYTFLCLVSRYKKSLA